MNPLVKKSLDRGQRAFKHLGITCGKLLGDVLEHRVDNGSPGGMPFPSERRHFRANSPPVGWVVGPFYQTVHFESVHHLRDVAPHAAELLSQLTAAHPTDPAHPHRASRT